MTGRSYWRAFTLPGVAWLLLFVIVPAYAVLAMAMGKVNLLLQPVPAWNPADWNPGFLSKAFSGALPGGEFWPSVRNTIVYVAAALAVCFLIGYPVAYYVARHAKKTKALLIVLLVIPFWVSYLLRMLAWIGLLSSDGYVNKILIDLGIAHPPDWLNGNPYSVIIALVYGYVPYFILPVFAGLDRIDQSQIEAARDLGATPWQAFRRVTLPLSWPSILAGSALVVLPMFGDYYTNDLISASPRTNMLGNQINLFVQGGSEKNLGASLVIVLMAILAVLMAYYLFQTARDTKRLAVGMSARLPRRLRNPWGRPRFLVAVTWTYVFWALLPVLDRDAVLVQQRPVAQRLAGLLPALVVGRSVALDLPQLRLHARARAQPRARRARHADRDPARRAARSRPHPVARAGIRRRQRAHAGPARHARDRDGGVAAARVHAAGDRPVQRDPSRHDRTGRRAGDVLGVLRRRDRPQPTDPDRPRVSRRPPATSGRPRRGRCGTSSSRCCCRRSSPAC